MAINIKNFISLRCKITVEDDAGKDESFKPLIIEFGETQIKNVFSGEQLASLKAALVNNVELKPEMLLLEDQKKELAEKIKATIMDMIYNDYLPSTKYSHFISQKLNYSYNYLTMIFAEIKGTTIENFIILHKIEKVKELIIYTNLSLGTIAARMQYSSISHLSNQFKKVTGLTPTQYKKLKRSTAKIA